MDFARWLVVAVLTMVSPESYAAWPGIVVEIVRPGEFKVDKMGEVVNVRLYGVDCPLMVRNQPFGKEATAYAQRRLLGRVVQIQPLPGLIKGPWYRPKILPYDDLYWDGNVGSRYQRIIALAYVEGESISEDYLKNGIGWWYRPFVPFERGYKYLEDQARKAKVGLWATPEAKPPWEWQRTPIADINPWQRGGGTLVAFGGAALATAAVVAMAVLLIRRLLSRARKTNQAETDRQVSLR